MIRVSYTLKCWMLGITYFSVFYFIVVMSDPSFAKYAYALALSTLLFPIAKRAVDVMTDFFAPDIELFNGLLPSILINVVIWIFTPVIVAFTIVAYLLYSMGVMTENISH